MSNTTKFENPYKADLDAGCDRIKVGATIPTEAYNKVRSVRLGQGTIEATVATLWNKLTDELESRGIINFNHVTAFEHFLANARFVLPGEAYDTEPSRPAVANVPGGPVALSDGQTLQRNVPRREAPEGRGLAPASAGSPDIKVGPKPGSGGSGGRGRKAGSASNG